MSKYESTGRFINLSKDTGIFAKTGMRLMPTSCEACSYTENCKYYTPSTNVRPNDCPLVKGVEVK